MEAKQVDLQEGRRLLDASNGRLFNRLALHNERPTTEWHDWVLDNAEALLTFAERAQAVLERASTGEAWDADGNDVLEDIEDVLASLTTTAPVCPCLHLGHGCASSDGCDTCRGFKATWTTPVDEVRAVKAPPPANSRVTTLEARAIIQSLLPPKTGDEVRQ